MKEVFEGSLWEAELIKGLLQTENVDCMLRDETLGAVTSPYLTSGGNVKILVNDEDYQRASRIVAAR
ncbi:MAG: DUF2007 domain-containing protein [Bacteroidaceae bacterium]|nr:DUF2007 domain-containing protein [Bacteroidaceae bacterium]MBR6589301.1 DUF2007 domain-containing protein [Bacteroidaceae bacterium]